MIKGIQLTFATVCIAGSILAQADSIDTEVVVSSVDSSESSSVSENSEPAVVKPVASESTFVPDFGGDKEEDKGGLDLMSPAEGPEFVSGKEFRPDLGVGLGYYTFFGDVSSSETRSIHASPMVYSFYAARRITNYLDLGLRFSTGGMVGQQSGANGANLNFYSIMHDGSAFVAYDFSNFIGDDAALRPYLTLGISVFEFNNKGDLYDAAGNEYHYWSDGRIMNVAENSPFAGNAIALQRDHVYETDLRKANLDGFGIYSQMGVGIPFGTEMEFNATDRLSFRVGYVFTLSFTDLIDNVTENSVGNRAGNSGGDHFMQSKISLHYDLFNKRIKKEVKEFEWVDYLAMDVEDDDKDGVINEFDLCPFTELAAEVDDNGCVLDLDEDKIPDHSDDELSTAPLADVTDHGVTYTDDDYLNWYRRFIDSVDIPQEVLERLGNRRDRSGSYRVQVKLVRAGEQVNDSDFIELMELQDIEAIQDNEANTAYVAGKFSDLEKAEVRRDYLIAGGIEDAKVIVFDDGEIMSPEAWDKLVERQMRDQYPGDYDKIKEMEDFYAVKLGSLKKGAPIYDRAKFLEDMSVVELEGDPGMIDYVTGPFIDTVSAKQNLEEYVKKGFPDAEIVLVKNSKVVQLDQENLDNALDDIIAADLEDDELEDFIKVKKHDGKFVVIPGTATSKTSYKDKKKLIDEGLLAIQNPDRSISYVFDEGFEDKQTARDKRNEFREKGFKDARIATVIIEDQKLRLEIEDVLDNDMYTICLGSYKSKVPNDDVDKILSLHDVRSVESYNPNMTSYTIGVYHSKAEAKSRLVELIGQGFDPQICKYEDEQIKELPSILTPSQVENINTPDEVQTDEVAYRVQIGAFSKRVPHSAFKGIEVLEFRGPNGLIRYVTAGRLTYKSAYQLKLKVQKLGFSDAFVVAHKDGKRMPMKDLVNDEEIKKLRDQYGSADFASAEDVTYKVQVGAFKDFSKEHNKLREYDNIEMEIYGDYKRILTGNFKTYPEAIKFKEMIKAKGYPNAFVVAYANGNRMAPEGVNPFEIGPNEGKEDIVPKKIQGLHIYVQIGLYRGDLPPDVKKRFSSLNNITKQISPEGITRYMAGNFQDPISATAYKEELKSKGFEGVFLVAFYNSQRIDIKEAVELAK